MQNNNSSKDNKNAPPQETKQPPKRAPQWQEPEPQSTQKFITPEAEKSMREGAGQYRVVKLNITTPPAKKRQAVSHSASERQKTVHGGKIGLWEAVLEEMRDRLRTFRMGISISSEELIRGVICGAFIIVFALLQTTFFNKFALFGAVPDIMLSLVAAIAIWEGEKWGAVCGLCAAFVIQSLGALVSAPDFLPLLYCAAGYAIGILAGYYVSNSLPVKALYILGTCMGRALVTLITGSIITGATFAQVAIDMALPEFFSTMVMAPAVYFLFWISVKWLHRSRQQKTDMSDIF